MAKITTYSEFQCGTTMMWFPTEINSSRMDQFRKRISEKYKVILDDYWSLHSWSVQKFPEFWKEVWNFAGIVHSESYSSIIEKNKSIEEIPLWFIGSKLNYAENLLRYRDNHIALYIAGEAYKNPIPITYAKLFDQVCLYASVLKKAGVQSGDRVVGYLPNQLEAIVAMLATSSMGAIWSSTSTDFGSTAVLDRFLQIQPKVLFSIDQVVYNGKQHDNLEKLHKIADGLPSLELLLIVQFDKTKTLADISKIPKSYLLTIALDEAYQQAAGIPPLEFKQVPFNHPLFILYSSGTTGAPKCMVHSVGGTLIKHLSEHLLHGNMSRNDIIIYYTTIGWMMWNWLVSSLAVGATVVLYDGSPFFPHPAVIWDLVDKINITILGTGAKWIALCEDKGLKPRETHNLSSLHTILSTGSPLSPHSFDYVYRDIKKNILLGSITGGSDIISCFAGQNPIISVNRGEIQGPLLGMAVECYDDHGNSVKGQKGELICAKPFPSMPVFFWDDHNGEKYQKAYFQKFLRVWSHGDFCIISPTTGGITMLGRSDGILNPGGIRFGSAEIYNIVEAMKEIEDSICVSQCNKEGDERVVLFVKMSPKHVFSEELAIKIRQAIRNELSARHIPGIILDAKDIPYTVNGKKVEVAVKKVIAGESVSNKEAISNPDSLKYFCGRSELSEF